MARAQQPTLDKSVLFVLCWEIKIAAATALGCFAAECPA